MNNNETEITAFCWRLSYKNKLFRMNGKPRFFTLFEYIYHLKSFGYAPFSRGKYLNWRIIFITKSIIDIYSRMSSDIRLSIFYCMRPAKMWSVQSCHYFNQFPVMPVRCKQFRFQYCYLYYCSYVLIECQSKFDDCNFRNHLNDFVFVL